MDVKVLVIPITGPGDVLKLQDILAEALRDGMPGLHGIGCKCGLGGCDKHVDVHKMLDGRINVILYKGADIIAGITLDRAGAMDLAEKLQGA